MKKTSKMLGAIGLSAAMVMGTAVPAFATGSDFDGNADGAWTNKYGVEGDSAADPNSKQGTMGTTAWMAATTYQIDATVPLNIAMVGDMAGGQLMTPHPGVYRIINNNEQASLYVTDINVKLNPDRASGATDAPDWTPATDAAFSATPALNPYAAGTNPRYGTISAQMTAGKLAASTDTSITDETAKKAARTLTPSYEAFTIVGSATDKSTGTYAINKFTPAGTSDESDHMVIAKADGTTMNNELGLKLDVASSELESAYDEETGFVKVFKITYTVKAPQYYDDTQAGGTDFFKQWDMQDEGNLQGE